MKKAWFILSLVFMLLFYSPNVFAAELTSAEDYYEAGLTFFKQEEYFKAINNYKIAIKLDPKYGQAYLDIGDSYYNLQEYKEAIEAYDALIKLEPLNDYAYYSKGLALHFLYKYEEAVKEYDKAIKINSSYADAYVSKGDSLNRLERYSEATKCFDKAAKLNPKDNDINISRGNTYYFQGLYEQAIAYYDIAIKAHSSNKFVYTNKGNALYYLSRYDEAIKDLEQGLKLVPDDAEANYYMSVSLVKTGNTKGYFSYLEKAVSLDRFYMEKARTEEAFKSLSKDEAFIGIIYDAKESIRNQFKNAGILQKGALASIHFLDLKTSGNAEEDAKILKAEQEFSKNYYEGAIYNSASADKYHIHSNSPFRDETIKLGRIIKGQTLVGLKVTYSFSKKDILYIGKQDGALKAAIIEVTGAFKIDDQFIDGNDYAIFIYNNGTWKYYGYLELNK